MIRLKLYVNQRPFLKAWIIRVLDTFPILKRSIRKITIPEFEQSQIGLHDRLSLDLCDLLKHVSVVNRTKSRGMERRQFFVDISELVRVDVKTGIQRVVRSILGELSKQLTDFDVEPVYAIQGYSGYYYASDLVSDEDGLVKPARVINYRSGDIFLGLDFQPEIVFANRYFYQTLRKQGVSVKFAVYDLLPLSLPDRFAKAMSVNHRQWIEIIAASDGVLCISESVANELKLWLVEQNLYRSSFKIDWFHLGADIDASMPSKGMPDDAALILARMKERPAFLMVGTLEPRKGQKQTLAAFDLLWTKGVDANLIIVGKRGWLMDEFAEHLARHAESGQRLFWIDKASDEYLEAIYATSTCLIAASEGEGFGLPLIEAAQHNKFIIARDIPVFREIAGKHAFYFSGMRAAELATAIESWLSLCTQELAPSSEGMAWLTWRQSADSLKEKLFQR